MPRWRAVLSFGLVTVIWTVAFLCLETSAANWPQFRGPQASGVDASRAAPIRWDATNGEALRWHTPIPGLAHASPILWGDRLYVATAVRPGQAELKIGLYGDTTSANDQESHQWRLLALDRGTGKILWDKLGYEGVPRLKRHPKSSHCSSTPATDGRRLVALFGSEGLFCFDMEGQLLWHKDLGPMDASYFQAPSAQWGFASSPVIHQGKVIVLCDVLTNSFLAAFDLESGNPLWRTARHDVPTWGTPTVVRVGDRTQILVNGWHHTGAYDFANGREIWKLDGGGDIPVPTPVIGQGLAIFTSAHGRLRPMRAIRLEAQGDLTPSDSAAAIPQDPPGQPFNPGMGDTTPVKPGSTNGAIAWSYPRQGDYLQTPVVVGDHVYGCSDNGVLTCFDLKTGAIRYSERLGNGRGGFSASPVSDGRHLYFTSEVGQVFVLPATDQFTVLATNNLGAICMATPIVAEGVLYFRTRDQVVAIAP